MPGKVTKEFKTKLQNFDPLNEDCWRRLYCVQDGSLTVPVMEQGMPRSEQAIETALGKLCELSANGQLYCSGEDGQSPRKLKIARSEGGDWSVTPDEKRLEEITAPKGLSILTILGAFFGISSCKKKKAEHEQAEREFKALPALISQIKDVQKTVGARKKKAVETLSSLAKDSVTRSNYDRLLNSVYGAKAAKLDGALKPLTEQIPADTDYTVPEDMTEDMTRALVQLACNDKTVRKNNHADNGLEVEHRAVGVIHTRSDILNERKGSEQRFLGTIGEARRIVKNALEQDTKEKRNAVIGKIIGRNLSDFVNFYGNMEKATVSHVRCLQENAAILGLLENKAIMKNAFAAGLKPETVQALRAQSNFVDLTKKKTAARSELLQSGSGTDPKTVSEKVADILLCDSVEKIMTAFFKTGAKSVEDEMERYVKSVTSACEKEAKKRREEAEKEDPAHLKEAEKRIDAEKDAKISNCVGQSMECGQMVRADKPVSGQILCLGDPDVISNMRNALKKTEQFRQLCEDVEKKGADQVLTDNARMKENMEKLLGETFIPMLKNHEKELPEKFEEQREELRNSYLEENIVSNTITSSFGKKETEKTADSEKAPAALGKG